MYSCLELKSNSILTSFKDRLPCALVSSAKQMFHIQKTPTLILYKVLLKKLLWLLHFPTEQTVSWCRVRRRKTLWHAVIQKPFIFSPSLSSENLTRALNRKQVIYSCWNLPLPLTKTPYWSPHSCSSLFHPLPWAYKFIWSVSWMGAENWSG